MWWNPGGIQASARCERSTDRAGSAGAHSGHGARGAERAARGDRRGRLAGASSRRGGVFAHCLDNGKQMTQSSRLA